MKNKKLKYIISALLLTTIIGCGSNTTANTEADPGQEKLNAEATTEAKPGAAQDADAAKGEDAAQAAAITQDFAQDTAAAPTLAISDEDFYAEILDQNYYVLLNQKIYDNFYLPYSMLTYAYSVDGYDKEKALDYSGYGFEDLDGDGMNELIIGNISDDPKLDKMIYTIYTRHNNVPYNVITATDYTNYYLCSGKFIGYEQHGSKWYNEAGLYELTSKDPGMTLITGVKSDRADDDSMTWQKTDVSGKEFTITDGEAQKTMEEYRGRRIAPTLTAFSNYKPQNPEDYYDHIASSTFGKGYDSWNEGYLAYLEEKMPEDMMDMSFALIYVDDDDVPELVIDSGFEAGGCQILSFYDGTVRELQTARLYFTYIEKSGLLNNSEGHMGYYYDYVYKLDKGLWKLVLGGDYYELDENATEEDQMYNEETGRFRTLHYSIDGEETDEETYMSRLGEVYDLDKAKDPSSYLRIDDLKSYLSTGKYVSDGHRYELVIEDCTWEEAAKKCEEKGGYLACLTTDEEFEIIDDLIRSEDKLNNVFYIGANRIDSFSWHWTDPSLTQDECLGNGYWKHWLDGMPSYSDKLPDGTEIDEEYVEYFYRKSEDKFYMNDIPNDVIGYYPSCKGRMGYICEYN